MERCSHHWCIRLWSVTISFFPSVHVCPSCDACWPVLGDRSFWVVLISTLFTPFLKRQQHFLGLSDPAPTSAPSEKSRSGISWMVWNYLLLGQHHFICLLNLFFFLFFYSPSYNFIFSRPFFSCTFFFLSWGQFFFHHIFFGLTLDPNFFWELPTSPSNLPTTLPLTNPPTSFTPPTSFSTHLHCQSLKTRENFSSSELWLGFQHFESP